MEKNITEQIQIKKMRIIKDGGLKKIYHILKENDFKVYTSQGKEIVTWFVFENQNGDLGYAQAEYSGVYFSTEHKPMKNFGTGFRITQYPVSDPTLHDAIGAFVHHPGWADYKYRGDIKKWKNFEEYRSNKINSILKYEEI